MQLRRALRRRRGRDAVHRQFASSDTSSDDHNQGSDHRSPRVVDEKPVTSNRSHDHEKVGASTSSQPSQPVASIIHDHEQAGPSTSIHHDR